MNKKFIGNTAWLVGGKIFEMLVGLAVSMLTARYLGPANYGLINYVSAFTTFFVCICTLGLLNTMVNELITHPDRQGEILGTSIVLRLITSALSVAAIVLLVWVMNLGDTERLIVAVLYSLNLVFQSFDVISYYFQSKLQSWKTSLVTMSAFLAMSAYKVYLLVTQKSIEWFAFSVTLDYILISVLLLIVYKKSGGQKLKCDLKLGRDLVKRSWHFILSGLMVAIYGQSDKIMLSHMIDDTATGLYTTAATISNIWVFVLAAIVDSARPLLFAQYDTDKAAYKKNTERLYCAIIYISAAVALVFTFCPKFIINILYGEQYLDAAAPLRVLGWSVIFSYVGVVSNIYLIVEKKEKYIKYMALIGAVCNIVLNYFLIGVWGPAGAALATVITQFVVNFVLMFLFKPMRENAAMIVKGFNPVNLFGVFGMLRHKKAVAAAGAEFKKETEKSAETKISEKINTENNSEEKGKEK